MKELIEKMPQVELTGQGRLSRHRFNAKFNEIRIEFSIEMVSMQDSMLIEREGFPAPSTARAQPRSRPRGHGSTSALKAETFSQD
jgi:hypothetical protein